MSRDLPIRGASRLLPYIAAFALLLAASNSGRGTERRKNDTRTKAEVEALTDTPNQIIEKQGLKGVDATTSATITSEAIISATAKTLASGLE